MRSFINTANTMTICINLVGCVGMDELRVRASQRPRLYARGLHAFGGLKYHFKRFLPSAGGCGSRTSGLPRVPASWQLQQLRLLASIA